MKNLSFLSKAVLVTLLFTGFACNYSPGKKGSETQSAVKDSGEIWIQLFNGKDLDDWEIKFKGYELGNNYKNTFRVEDGLLRVRYDDWDSFDNVFGHIFYKKEFSHYRLRAEYRFLDQRAPGCPDWAVRNNGLMLHGQKAETMELDQDFPVSIEAQLLGGNGTDERPTMNVCTPGTNIVMDGELIERHCTSSDSKTYHGDQWVSVEVEVHGGDVIRHFVEGVEVMHYEKPQLDPREPYYEKLLPADGNKILTKGTISLQAEGNATDFRKIELMVLDE